MIKVVMIDCKADCRWVERCDAASAFKYHRESCPVFGEKEQHIQTNADFIRSLTDEELAEVLTTINRGRISAKEYLYWLKLEKGRHI